VTYFALCHLHHTCPHHSRAAALAIIGISLAIVAVSGLAVRWWLSR
jgi:hypothetical protein